MYAHSARFAQAVREGAPVVTTVDIAKGGAIVMADIPIGRPSTVTIDETASSWRACAVTAIDIDRDLLPRTPLDALAPYGTDLVIRSGFRFPDGTIEQMPCGLFRIVTTRPRRKGPINLVGFDYSRVVARARFEIPKVFARGTKNTVGIRTLVAERVAFANFELTDTGLTLPLTIFEEGERYGSPWKACMEMAEAAGCQVFFGPDGPAPRLIARPSPDVTDPPVWTVAAGDGSTLTDMEPDLDSQEAYNVYVVTGESADLATDGTGPVRGSAEITDPSSPVYPGTFGRAPIFLTSSFMRTNAQCAQVAKANLPLKAGGSEGLTITAFANPAHEAGDPVLAQDPELGIDRVVTLSRFTLDLFGQDACQYVARSRRVA